MRPLAAAVVLALSGGIPAARALPSGANVVVGDVTISSPSSTQLNLNQSTRSAIVDWRSFSIAHNEAVRLTQPSQGVALFRVTGNDPSQIFGQLSATGSLFLSNPQGVLFGQGARVDVGSLTATTLSIGNSDFLSGNYRFAGDSRARVENQGVINAAQGGHVVLLGREVINSGDISAPRGTVALGAAGAATLDVYGNGLLKLSLEGGAGGARIDHGGRIFADGGAASLATSGTATAPAAINVSGLVRAQSLVEREGAIYLAGGPGSQINLSGSGLLDVSAAPGAANGGRIEVAGERIAADAGAQFRADAGTRGNGGTVNVIANDAMNFAGSISARGGAAGGDGGNAEVSGYATLSMNGSSNLSAPAGRTGTLLLDPGSITIIDSVGSENGPNIFGDANLATLLGTNNITLSTANATNGGPETITVNGNANVTWSAATTLRLDAGRNIVVGSGAVIRNTNASTSFTAVLLNANRGATPATGVFFGVDQQGLIETTGGGISINGRGGSTGDAAHGVFFTGGTLRTVNGAIRIDGQGGSSPGALPIGVWLQGNAVIEATGSGSIGITGVGGTAPASSVAIGVAIPTLNAVVLRTTTGGLSVSGTGGAGSDNIGIIDQGTTTYASTSGAITLRGLSPSNQPGILMSEETSTLTSTTGNITLGADQMDLSLVNGRTGGTLTLQPTTAGRAINIGGADSSTTLGLTAAELAGFAPSGRLQIGNASAGNLTVSTAYAPTVGTGTLALASGGTVDVNAAITGGATRLNLNGTTGVRLGAGLSSAAANIGATRAITIRTPGVFDNPFGATALSTPSGTWSISLATPVGQNFNGLLSNNLAVWNNPVTSNVTPTGNRYSFAVAPTIFVDAGSVANLYGDTLSASPTLAAAPIATVANTFGGVFTDYQSGTVSGSYTRASTGLAGTANVGSYALTVTSVAGLSTSNAGYGFAIGRAGTVNVAPRPITIAPNAVLRLYGDANPLTGAASATAGTLVNGDAIGSVALFSPAIATSNAGNYDVTASSAIFSAGLASNYLVSYGTRSNGLTVAPRPLTLTPDAVSRIYGDANPARGAAAITAGNLVGSDTITDVALSSAANAASFVGSYATTASNALFGSGLSSNYSIIYAPNASGLLVTPRSLTLTADAVSRLYGDANPASATATGNAGGLVNGDSVSSVSLSTPATLTSNVGSYATTSSNAVFGNGLASNYAISYAPNAGGLLVTPRSLILTADAVSRLYGDTNPASATATGNAGGLVNGDTVSSVNLSTLATVASNVGSYTTTGSNALFSSGLASNYAISYAPNAGGLLVTPRSLILTADTVSRLYGEANPASATATGNAGGLVNGDSVSSVSLSTPATLTSNVGSYATTSSNAVFGNGLASNYAISYAPNAGGLLVTPRSLTLTADAVSRLYGDANPASATATGNAGGLVNGDTVSSVSLSTPATVASNVGSYVTTGSNALFGSGLASNYSIIYAPNTGGLSITPRAVTLTPDAVARAYGDANPLTGSAAGNAGGLVNGDTVLQVSLSSPATLTSNVGSYDTTGSNALFGNGLASNYSIIYAPNVGGLSITPRPLTLTADAVSRLYGDTNPASATATGNAGGLTNGDSVSSVSLSTPATVTSNVGSYATTGSDALFGSGLASNYSVIYAPNVGGLSITPRTVTLTPVAVSRAYGDANPSTSSATGNASGLVNGDTVASVTLASSATVASHVGNYATTGSNALFGNGLASNYNVIYAPNASGLAITPRAVTLTPDAVTRAYGDANPSTGSAAGNAGGLVNGDTVSSVSLSTPATLTSNVGSYATTGSNALFGSGLASNYAISYAPNAAGLSITPRSLILTADAVSRLYGDTNPTSATATGNAGGLVNGDSVSSVSLSTPATVASNVGSYATTGSNALFGNGLAGNYAITYSTNGAGLRITPRPLTVAALPNQGKLPGQTDPALGFRIINGSLVNGDVLAGLPVRQPGETPGFYPIEQGNLSAGTNYALDYRGALFSIGRTQQVATLDRNPSQSNVLSGAPLPLPDVRAPLPPTAAKDASTNCVREQGLDRDRAATTRVVNQGMRLPEGVVDRCR